MTDNAARHPSPHQAAVVRAATSDPPVRATLTAPGGAGAASSEPAPTRNVCIGNPLWEGLAMVARLNHTSMSEELRRAGLAHLERYGLSLVDGELTINPLLWPAEVPPA